MRRTTLDRIAPLLEVRSAHPALRGVWPTVFHLKSRDFLHFHDEPEGICADVRLTKSFVRFPVSSSSKQLELRERIERSLSSLEAQPNRPEGGCHGAVPRGSHRA